MRRKEREVSDFDEILKILEKCQVIHLAMISEGKPYSVPVNFGYCVKEENGSKKIELYFHGAGEGKKVSALKANPQVCFSTECLHQTESADGSEQACSWTCYYESVIGSGKAVLIEDKNEKNAAMDCLMFHCGYKLPAGVKFIAYNMMTFARTAVFKIQIEEISGKRHLKK